MEGGRGTRRTGRIWHGEAYEELVSRVYLTAVRLGAPTRSGLVAEGLTEEEVDEGVAELLARELLEPGPDPTSWSVPSPRDAIARNADRTERRIALSRASATEVDAIWRRSRSTGTEVVNPNFDLLTSVTDIADRVSGMHRLATTRIWCAYDASEATRQLFARAIAEPELLRVREGVEVRIVLDIGLLGDEGAMAHLERSVAAGHGVRVGNGIPLSLFACDRTALIDLSAYDSSGLGSIEVRGPAPVKAVGRLLEEIWILSTPYGPTVAAGAREAGQRAPLDSRDERVLHLLSTGASDQLIARQIGASVRTVERRVRYLMEHLGAATRFQAGVMAVRRGWLSADDG